MITRTFQVALQWDTEDRVWVTYVPSLEFLSTYGETLDEALARTHEAIAGYLGAAAKEGISVPSENPPAELVSLDVPL